MLCHSVKANERMYAHWFLGKNASNALWLYVIHTMYLCAFYTKHLSLYFSGLCSFAFDSGFFPLSRRKSYKKPTRIKENKEEKNPNDLK